MLRTRWNTTSESEGQSDNRSWKDSAGSKRCGVRKLPLPKPQALPRRRDASFAFNRILKVGNRGGVAQTHGYQPTIYLFHYDLPPAQKNVSSSLAQIATRVRHMSPQTCTGAIMVTHKTTPGFSSTSVPKTNLWRPKLVALPSAHYY